MADSIHGDTCVTRLTPWQVSCVKRLTFQCVGSLESSRRYR